jgi:hypothetical protein
MTGATGSDHLPDGGASARTPRQIYPMNPNPAARQAAFFPVMPIGGKEQKAHLIG